MVSKLEISRALHPGRSFRRRLTDCVLTIVSLSTVIVATAPAHGDPDNSASAAVDESFLGALNAANITYTNAGEAIRAGHTMCELVDNGKSDKQIISTLQKYNESLTAEHAAQFMAIAFQSYCPQNLEIVINNKSAVTPEPQRSTPHE